MADTWEPPRCIHGHIVLGCPHDDCPTQTAYLDQQEAAMRGFWARQQEAARRHVRMALGLPDDPAPLLACGHPDTDPTVHHDHEGQPSCFECCDTCTPGQGT